MRSLGSDNHAGIHPALLDALVSVNVGHAAAYQSDAVSQACQRVWQAHFGHVSVSYVFNGTAANVLALRALLPQHGAVVCSDVAHVAQDAGGSPEKMLGCKVLVAPSVHGKLTAAALVPLCGRAGDQHVAQIKVLSLTQPTECGTVYTPEELLTLCDFAHARGWRVHMDGARLIHAATTLHCGLAAISRDVGVDALAFGGTKHGLLGGEAVLVFDTALARDLRYARKQLMQLPSKTRFLAAQFQRFLQGTLYQQISAHMVSLAQDLALGLAGVPGVRLCHPVEANLVFVAFAKAWIKPLRQHVFFYVWQPGETCVGRFVVSFDTTKADIAAVVAAFDHLGQAPRTPCALLEPDEGFC